MLNNFVNDAVTTAQLYEDAENGICSNEPNPNYIPPPSVPRSGSKVGCKYKLPCGMCEILKVYCTERKCKNG